MRLTEKHGNFLLYCAGFFFNLMTAFLLSFTVFLPAERTDLFPLCATMFVINFFAAVYMGATIPSEYRRMKK